MCSYCIVSLLLCEFCPTSAQTCTYPGRAAVCSVNLFDYYIGLQVLFRVPFGSLIRNNNITYSGYMVLAVQRGVRGRIRGGGSLEVRIPSVNPVFNGGNTYYNLY